MADLRAKQPEDFDLHVIEAFNEIIRLTLHRRADTTDAFQQLKTQRKVGDGVG
jgi:hypothetical protein